MKIIKKELLEEIGVNSQDSVPKFSSSNLRGKLKERIESLSKSYENCKQKDYKKKSNKKINKAIKIQAWFRGCIARKLCKKLNSIQSSVVISKEVQTETKFEKIPRNKKPENLRDKLIEEIQSVENQLESINQQDMNDSSLIQRESKELYGMLKPSIKDPDSSLGDTNEFEGPKPLFGTNSFHEFTLKKFKDLMKIGRASCRERVYVLV